MSDYNIEMYSLLKFDKEKRTSFKLPFGSPYVAKESKETLRELGVIYFRDSDHAHGILIEPSQGEELRNKRGFTSYYFRSICDEEDCEAHIWDREDQVADAPTVEDYEKKHGDDRAWLAFNEEVSIMKITAAAVQIA